MSEPTPETLSAISQFKLALAGAVAGNLPVIGRGIYLIIKSKLESNEKRYQVEAESSTTVQIAEIHDGAELRRFLQGVMNDQHRQYVEIQDRLDKITEERTQDTKQILELTRELLEAKVKIETLEKKYTTLKDDHEVLKADYEELKAEYEKVLRRKEEVERQLSNLINGTKTTK